MDGRTHTHSSVDSPGDYPGFRMLVRDVEQSTSQNLHVLQVSFTGHQVAVDIHPCRDTTPSYVSRTSIWTKYIF